MPEWSLGPWDFLLQRFWTLTNRWVWRCPREARGMHDLQGHGLQKSITGWFECELHKIQGPVKLPSHILKDTLNCKHPHVWRESRALETLSSIKKQCNCIGNRAVIPLTRGFNNLIIKKFSRDTWVTHRLSICFRLRVWSWGSRIESHIGLPECSLLLPLFVSLPLSVCLSWINKWNI